jgi:rhomboid family GlyGly-CTERM serine protease
MTRVLRGNRLRGQWLWPVSLAATIAASGWMSHEALDLLRWQRDSVTAGEWWRLLTAHLVHLSASHAIMNAAALLLIVTLAPVVRRPMAGICLLLVSAIAVDAGLVRLAPDIDWYAGASGMLHGLFAGAACLMLADRDWRIGSLMLLVVVAKLSWELMGGGNLSGADFPVVHEAHVFGAIGGLAGALLLLIGSRAGVVSISAATSER